MRLITRSDFDGLVCAVLLEEKGIIDSYKFVHPKDIQDGTIEVGPNDILANVPFLEGCGIWFDHHNSEMERLNMEKTKFEGALEQVASTAQVVWNYYGGEKSFRSDLRQLIQIANIADSAAYTQEEVLNPAGWVLLSFLVDPRTGMGYYKDYDISNYQLMLDIIGYCRTMPIEEILKQKDVKQRVDRYFEHQKPFKDMLKRVSHTERNLIRTNLLDEYTIYCGNRFIIYGIYPDQNVEIRIQWGRQNRNIVVACGHSILNRSCRTNVGKLMLEYGGGGHSSAGTCQIPIENWEKTVNEITDYVVGRG